MLVSLAHGRLNRQIMSSRPAWATRKIPIEVLFFPDLSFIFSFFSLQKALLQSFMVSLENSFPPLCLSLGIQESWVVALSLTQPPSCAGTHTLHPTDKAAPQPQLHPGEQEGEESTLRPRLCAVSVEDQEEHLESMEKDVYG
jgi:hypothetical protein